MSAFALLFWWLLNPGKPAVFPTMVACVTTPFAPGPTWTPLIPSTVRPREGLRLRRQCADETAGQPEEVAPCYFFLASDDSSYMTGQILHPNGGSVVNG
ncbi:MAG TPA: SDR family oxidoreductase [Chthoniobacterales bacterium]